MKRTITLLALLLALSMLLTGCGTNYRKGKIDGNTWESQWLGLRYECPGTMMILNREEEEAESAKEEYGIWYEMAAIEPQTAENILITTTRLADKEMDLDTFLATALVTIEDSGAVPGEVTEQELGKGVFSVVSAEKEVDGFVMYMKVCFCLRGGYVAQITATATSPERLDAIMSGFSDL